MTALVFGQRMVRLEDGQKGVVSQHGPELRIVYQDRGEERLAGKSEKWAPDEIALGALKPVEIFLIAATRDRALRAYERNEPHKYWETIPLSYRAHDEGLMRVIEGYLAARGARPAAND